MHLNVEQNIIYPAAYCKGNQRRKSKYISWEEDE